MLIQGEGFHRANKHPVGSTGVHMAAGRTSALMTSGSFKKQSAGERHDLFGNANQHCQQALPWPAAVEAMDSPHCTKPRENHEVKIYRNFNTNLV